MIARQQTPPPAPATPVTPAWALYVYDDIAYMTHNGRLIAWASVATSAQDAHITDVFDRLTARTVSRSGS